MGRAASTSQDQPSRRENEMTSRQAAIAFLERGKAPQTRENLDLAFELMFKAAQSKAPHLCHEILGAKIDNLTGKFAGPSSSPTKGSDVRTIPTANVNGQLSTAEDVLAVIEEARESAGGRLPAFIQWSGGNTEAPFNSVLHFQIEEPQKKAAQNLGLFPGLKAPSITVYGDFNRKLAYQPLDGF
jgi:hypothetical protein